MSVLDKIKKLKNLKNLNPESQVSQLAKKAAMYLSLGVSAAFLAALAYFAHLGKVAFFGFKIGATAGGTAGAIWGGYIGIQVGIALAPYTFGISLIVAPPLGVLIGAIGGATLLGIAGGLIALGLDQGSAGLVSTGVGAGVGGIIGTYVAGAFISFAIGACAATVFGCLLVPIAVVSAPIIIVTFSAIGAGAGYLIGNYVIDPVKSYIGGVSISGSASGFLSWLGGGITGLGSWAVGGLFSLGGLAVDGITSIGSKLLGTLSTSAGPLAGKLAGISVGTAFTSAATLSLLQTGVLTPGKFATTQTDISKPAGANQYVTVTKTANPTTISNSSLPTDINYLVTVKVNSYALTNVVCTDVTTLKKSDGTTQNLTNTLIGPLCPSQLNPAQVLTFNLSTHADNTPDFINSTVSNTFTINFDVTGGGAPPPTGGGGPCSANSGFNALLPNPIPPSVGATSPSSLPPDPAIIQAAQQATLQTGVPCEMLVGIQYREAGWDANSSFLSGTTLCSSGNFAICKPEPNITSSSACTGYGGTWYSGGCYFTSLNQTALASASYILGEVSSLTRGPERPPKNYDEMIGAMSYYNGGGNANCGAGVPYTGPCPGPIGIDDPYAVNHFDSDHATMYLLYCSQYTDASGVVHGIPCDPPRVLTTDGAATAAKEYYLKIGGH